MYKEIYNPNSNPNSNSINNNAISNSNSSSNLNNSDKTDKSNPWNTVQVQQSEHPGARAAHSCEIINRKIYLFGGWNGKKALHDLFIFNLETSKWTEPEVSGTKPGLRNNHATCVHGKYLYLHGGHNGDVWLDDLYILDTSNFIWSKINVIGEIPSARACHSLSRVERKLYMFGGYDGSKCYNEVEVLDTENKTWVTLSCQGSIPLARNAHTITVVGKNLVLFGGHSGNKHLKDLFVFETETSSWIEPQFSGEAPEGLRGHTATHLGNKIFIFGGYDGKGRSNELFILNLTDMHWSHINDNDKFPGSRQRHSSVPIDNKRILIFGGFNGTKWLNDLHVLDVALLMENIITQDSSLEFQSDMKTLINNQDFSDVFFKIEGKIIYGHKAILSRRCTYLRDLFKAREQNFNPSTEIEIENISENVFLVILQFIYTGFITKNNQMEFSQMIQLLTWANEFGLKELKSLCENNLIYGMDCNSIIDILIASYKHNLADLKALSISFILANFQEVSKKKSFYNLEAYPQLLMEVMMLSLNKIEND